MDDNQKIIYKQYHLSQIAEKAMVMLEETMAELPGHASCPVTVSGSAGMGLTDALDIPFTREVRHPNSRGPAPAGHRHGYRASGAGREILFLAGRWRCMNGSCAGGTGAFIDQMATLLGISADDMNELASRSERVHSIASAAGVRKSDIQALLNQGATGGHSRQHLLRRSGQTVAGLARAEIRGTSLSGRPLTFLPQPRLAFDEVRASGLLPGKLLYYVTRRRPHTGSSLDLKERRRECADTTPC